MNVTKSRRKKAISPIIATVFLIAITLMVSIAFSGWFFGLLGSYTSTAQVSVSAVSCTGGGTKTITCTLTARNMGSGSTSVSSISATYGTFIANMTTRPVSVPAGATVTFIGIFTGSVKFSVGSSVTGMAYLTNDGSAPWAGMVYS